MSTDQVPAQKTTARVENLYIATGDDFISRPVEQFDLDFEGIVGDFHAGQTRKSSGREPWYERGTQIKNERQISLLSQEEMNAVAQDLDIEQLDGGRIGANFLLSGVPDFSRLPPRTQLFFPSGAVVRIDGYNAPCKIAGKALQDVHAGRTDIEFGFVKAAQEKRGLVGWVERPGAVFVHDVVKIRIWPQALYYVAK